ncbi:helix-turn-helix domain-containing protein [Lichenihabitans sp. Uapishka_5]|uniref:helix-turn-helix domain-containing protein n=1 Tax=Lichenihabitans sp. Uapishka_5 TaxID=3037302 RepID=UPI0029E7E962|nr:helix-turn-helix domain-containing protein [Lichenihabitans sp. Uapishka_5]MDX7953834.1 helix-turn-helix domain-containing protein [Lichenihabitans sp. Uapishka_5]
MTGACGGFGRIRIVDLERAVVGDLLALLGGSDLVAAYSERMEAELAAAAAERATRAAVLRQRYVDLEARLKGGLAKQMRGTLGDYPADVLDGSRETLFQELAKTDKDLKALAAAERTEDDLTPRGLEGGLRFVMANAPFKETDAHSDRFRSAFNRIVEGVEIGEGARPEEARVLVRLDLGPIIGSDSIDDPHRRVVRELTVPTFGEHRYQRGSRPDPVVAYDKRAGDLPDVVWFAIEGRAVHVADTLEATGWQLRALVDVARFCALTGMGELQRAYVGERGPLAKFEQAGRALIRSGALAALVDALDGSPHEIENPGRFLSTVVRPSPSEVAARIGLFRSPADAASGRREIVAKVLDGLSPTKVAYLHGIPTDAVRELVFRHRAGTLATFNTFDLGPQLPEAASRLREAAEGCLDPALALRLRIAAMSIAGASHRDVAAFTGWSEQTVSKWARVFRENGAAHLWQRTWCLRPHAIVVREWAGSHARKLAALATQLPTGRGGAAEALADWCAGASAKNVMAKLRGSITDFDRYLAILRASGIAGLASSLRSPVGTPTEEGDRLRILAVDARDAEVQRRVNLLADFADGHDVGGLSRRYGISPLVVEKTVQTWRDNGAVCNATETPAIALGCAELEELARYARSSGNEERPRPVAHWKTLREFCLAKFGHAPDATTFQRTCKAHGIQVAWRMADREGSG